MSEFEGRMPSHRLAQTEFGDDLQAVAQREMGDANRWVELVWLNRLTPPYITADPRRVSPTVLLSGSLIKVPAPLGVWVDNEETGQVFERDCAMVSRRLSVDELGDLAVFSGVDNLSQQLLHRVVTPKGQARRHPDYGCNVWRLQGRVTGPTAAALGSQYVAASLASDYRVRSVEAARATVDRDAIRVTARAVSISGGAVDVAFAADQ